MKNSMKNSMKNFMKYMKEEDGISTVEVLVIIAVLVAVALLFKDKLKAFVDTYFTKINGKANGAMD